jgi:hypothetical protein
MVIALDYDDTYTRDPEFWNMIIDLAQSRGHEVICVTMRYEKEGSQVIRDLHQRVDQIIFTERQAKYEFVTKMGIMPSVWIDDSPWFILMDAKA